MKASGWSSVPALEFLHSPDSDSSAEFGFLVR